MYIAASRCEGKSLKTPRAVKETIIVLGKILHLFKFNNNENIVWNKVVVINILCNIL